MRLAIGVHHGLKSARQLSDLGRFAESEGYESIWVTEDFYREEAFSMLGVLAGATEKIKLGLGVANPYTRNTALLAMGAATTSILSGGRFILGLGRGERRVVEGGMGVPYGEPFKILGECAQTLRALFNGDRARNGRLGPNGVRLNIGPLAGYIPIYLAAAGPKALRLAGRIAEGVILNAYSPVKYIQYAVEEVKKSAEEAGRTSSQIDLACVVIPRVSDDLSREIREMKKRLASVFFDSQVGKLLLERGGFDYSFLGELRVHMAAGEVEKAARLISDDIAQACYVAGSREECGRRLREYREAGVTLPILFPQLNQFKEVARSLKDY